MCPQPHDQKTSGQLCLMAPSMNKLHIVLELKFQQVPRELALVISLASLGGYVLPVVQLLLRRVCALDKGLSVRQRSLVYSAVLTCTGR